MNRIVFGFLMIICAVCTAFATDAPIDASDKNINDTDKEIVEIQQEINKSDHPETPDSNSIFNRISINADNPLDMNWNAALDITDPDLRPTGVVIPFLEDYPIESLEIKLHLLNLKF